MRLVLSPCYSGYVGQLGGADHPTSIAKVVTAHMTTKEGYFTRPLALLLWAVLAAGVMMMVLASPAWAATYTVNNIADTNDGACTTGSGGCTLREAMNTANNNGDGPDTVGFAQSLSGQTIRLGTQLPTIIDVDGITIEGGSANITISGQDKVRVFAVGKSPDGQSAELTLNKLTVAHGSTTGSGGAIDNTGGFLTVNDSTLSANSAGQGGGISNVGLLTVKNSTLSGNSAGLGGGIYNSDHGVATVINSTLSGNVASGTDKGFGGGIYNLHSVRVSSSTLSGNSATASQGGGGIYSVRDEFGFVDASISTTILANSTAGGNCHEPVGDGGLNIDSGTSCGFSPDSTSRSNTDPKLDPNGLQNNGGPTQTIALQPGSATQPGSPAIDVISDTNRTTPGCDFGWPTDQRGVARPQGSACDIGAFEFDATPPSVTINKASGQDDPTSASPIHFTAVFSEPVTGFDGSDVALSGTAGATTAVVSGGPTTFDVAVSGMTSDGTVIASIPANKATDIALNANSASTSDVNTVTYEAPNSAPTAVADSYTTKEDTPLSVEKPGVLSNDTDPDSGDTLGAVLVSGPSHAASFALNADGSFSYTPASNYNGPDSFTYKARDGHDADSAPVTVGITVSPVNDDPTATNSTASMAEDAAPITINFGDLVSDIETANATNLAYNVSIASADAGKGTLGSVASDPTKRTFDSAENFNGTVTINYTVTDRGDPDTCGPAGPNCAAAKSASGTVTVTVTPDNDPPTVTVAPGGSCSRTGVSGTMKLTVADFDSQVGDLTLTGSSSNTALVPTGKIVFGGSGADRTVTITTVPQKSAKSADVTITVSDGTAKKTITIKVIVGTDKKETINGTDSADMIFGLNGDDTINAGGGNDLACGGNGGGVISGGAGDDTIDGGNGNDTLRGQDGNDTLSGSLGNDRLEGGNDNDTLTGSLGSDFFSGGPGTDSVTDFKASEGDTKDNTIEP